MTARFRQGRHVTIASAAVVAAILAMVVALLAAGGAPTSVPAGLSGAGTTGSWAAPVLRLLADVAALAGAGGRLAGAWFLPPPSGAGTGGGAPGFPKAPPA